MNRIRLSPTVELSRHWRGEWQMTTLGARLPVWLGSGDVDAIISAVQQDVLARIREHLEVESRVPTWLGSHSCSALEDLIDSLEKQFATD